MAVSQAVLDAINRLRNYYNGNAYDAQNNPGGMARGGHRTNLIPSYRDLSDVASALSEEVTAAVNSATISQIARDQAVAARDEAQAIADSIGGGGGGGVGGDPVLAAIALAPVIDYQLTASNGFVGTVIRATTATYYGPDGRLRTAAANQTRITHDPATGKVLGVLVERVAATNLLLHSEDFTNAVWVKPVGTSVTGNNRNAPDGTQNADFILGETYQDVIFGAAGSAGGWRAFSVYLESNTATNITLTLGYMGDVNLPITGTATLNVATGVVTVDGTSGYGAATAYSENLGGGRYRVTVAMEGGYQNDRARCRITPSPSNASYWAWGAMLEPGRKPTSYVPSVASQGTRAAEDFVLPVNLADYDPLEGTLYVEFYHQGQSSGSTTTAALMIDNGNSSNSVALRLNGSAGSEQIQFATNNTGWFGTRALVSGLNKVAATWGTGTDYFSVGGSAVESASLASPTSRPTAVRLGAGNGSAGNGIYRRVVVWPRMTTNTTKLVEIAGLP